MESVTAVKRTSLIILFIMPVIFFSSSVSGEKIPKEIRTAPNALLSADAHVQGICCNDSEIFLSFKNAIFKINWDGEVIKSVNVQPHAGDITYLDDHLFVSMSEPEGYGVFEYDDDLNLVAKHKLENAPATDGIAFVDGYFFIGGTSVGQKPHFDNQICQFDRQFNFIRKMTVNFEVPTHYGTQAIEGYEGTLIMAFYVAEGSKVQTIRTDTEMRVIERYSLFAGNGIAQVPPTKQTREGTFFLAARTENADTGNPVVVLRWFELDEGNFTDITGE